MHSVKQYLFTVLFLALWAVLSIGCGSSKPAVTEPPGAIPGWPETEAGPPPVSPFSPIGFLLRAETDGPSDWVRETMEGMTLEEKVAQMVFVRAFGYYQNDDEAGMRKLFDIVKRRQVGGVCLFQGEIYTSGVLLNRLQQMSGVPLLVSSDFEWGTGMRLRRASRFPEAMALGATRDTSLAYEMGRQIGLEARTIGIHQVYAPVCDVNNNPDNPVINTRSFGEDPALVAAMASAVARGIQSVGVLATAKHFPGHGDTDTDSHIGLPFMSQSRGRLDSMELVPFRALVRDGVGSVMTAHIEVPSLGGAGGLPATLSHYAIDSLLVRDMGFRGLVVTDAMEMSALRRNFRDDSAAVLAVEAGNDVLLLPPDADNAIDAVVSAVRSGRMSAARIDRSVRKILTLKEWTGLASNRYSDLYTISSVVAPDEAYRLAKEIARKSVTLLKNDNVLPLRREGRTSYRKPLRVVVWDVEDYRTEIFRHDPHWPNERGGIYFSNLLSRGSWMEQRRPVYLNPSSPRGEIDSTVKLAEESDVVIIAVLSKVRSANGKIGLPESLMVGLQRVISANPRSVLVSFGNPYVLTSLPGAAAYLCAYSDAEAPAEAAVEILTGETAAVGRLPVTLPGMYPYGAGIRTDQLALREEAPEESGLDQRLVARIDTVVMRAIGDSAFPGAQLLAVRDNIVCLDRAYGHYTYDPESPVVTRSSMYDLASMTKVYATTLAMMRLYDEGKWRLDDRVTGFLPRFAGGEKESVTVRQLLNHTSGLPPFRRYFLTCSTAAQMLDSIYATDLIARPGDTTIYSDFGFILLGQMVESITGTGLARYVDSVFYRPLGLGTTSFFPPVTSVGGEYPAAEEGDLSPPTEYDSVYRHMLVRGVVHDENAYALGGVSGHAGLFSSARDLARITQMLLNGGSYAGERYLSWETVRLFTDRRDSSTERGLGWDFKSLHGYTTSGEYFGPKSFGHTGFTGTSVWIDPESKIFVIFLTNRVYPSRNNQKIRLVRPAVHNAVMEALRDQETRIPH